MYVTNLTNRRLGLSGPIVLAAREKNRYIEEDNLKLVEAVHRAKAANLVSISKEEGLSKVITTDAVKTLVFDADGIGSKPRTKGKQLSVEAPVEEAKVEKVKPEVKTEELVAEVPETKEVEVEVENKDVKTEEEVVEEKPTKKSRRSKKA